MRRVPAELLVVLSAGAGLAVPDERLRILAQRRLVGDLTGHVTLFLHRKRRANLHPLVTRLLWRDSRQAVKGEHRDFSP